MLKPYKIENCHHPGCYRKHRCGSHGPFGGPLGDPWCTGCADMNMGSNQRIAIQLFCVDRTHVFFFFFYVPCRCSPNQSTHVFSKHESLTYMVAVLILMAKSRHLGCQILTLLRRTTFLWGAGLIRRNWGCSFHPVICREQWLLNPWWLMIS